MHRSYIASFALKFRISFPGSVLLICSAALKHRVIVKSINRSNVSLFMLVNLSSKLFYCITWESCHTIKTYNPVYCWVKTDIWRIYWQWYHNIIWMFIEILSHYVINNIDSPHMCTHNIHRHRILIMWSFVLNDNEFFNDSSWLILISDINK